MKVKTIFGIDTNGNDIFVVQKANMFKIIKEEPTASEWSDICIDFNLSHQEEVKLKEAFYEWKNWYKKVK